MIESLFNILPDFMKEKLAVRMVYTAGSFITARLIAFLTGDYLAKMLAEVVTYAAKIGIHIQIHVVSIDQKVLQSFITGVLMVGGEYLIEKFHTAKVLPVVAPQPQNTTTQGGTSK